MRTRQLPELLIGMGLVTMGPISQGLAVLSGAGRVPAGEVAMLPHALGALSGALGMACVYAFVMIVFRPGVAWARALFALAVVGLAISSAGSVMAIQSAPAAASSGVVLRHWGAATIAVFTVAFAWASLESGVQFASARKRVRIGITDPVVANRFLLWAISSATAFLLGVTLIGFQLDGSMGGALPSVLTMIVSIVSGATMYLAFLPPKAYLERVRAAAAAA
jgi:hypothetical protein